MAQVIENEPSYIFNVREYKESSVILSVLTLNYGQVSVMARGSSARSSLQPFTPLKLTLTPSKTDLYFLQDYECCGESYAFKLPVLFCATYLNELLYHLYHAKESNPVLFGTYVATLEALQQQNQIEKHLRVFELTLLECLGYGLSPMDQEGHPLQPRQLYRFGIGMGFIPVAAAKPINVSKQSFLQTIAALREEEQGNEDESQTTSSSTVQNSLSQNSAPQNSTATLTQGPLASQSSTEAGIQGSSVTSSAASWSDEELESAMRFSKHKVKGPKLSSPTYGVTGYTQNYSGLTTSDGRPISESELLGPAMYGDLLSRIVARSFDGEVLKQSKQLTNALFQFLLGKREIKSRQLYRDYLQMQAQRKAQELTKPQATTNEQGQLSQAATQQGQTTVSASISNTAPNTVPNTILNTAPNTAPNTALNPPAEQSVSTGEALEPAVKQTVSGTIKLDESVERSDNLTIKRVGKAKTGEVLQKQASVVESQLKQQQIEQAQVAKKRRTRKPKSEQSQLTEKGTEQGATRLGEVQLQPSEALLESEAKAKQQLAQKLETAKRKPRSKKTVAETKASRKTTKKSELSSTVYDTSDTANASNEPNASHASNATE